MTFDGKKLAHLEARGVPIFSFTTSSPLARMLGNPPDVGQDLKTLRGWRQGRLCRVCLLHHIRSSFLRGDSTVLGYHAYKMEIAYARSLTTP